VDGFSKIMARFFPASAGRSTPRARSALSAAARASRAERSPAISEIERRCFGADCGGIERLTVRLR
jgi:hypothetical protein